MKACVLITALHACRYEEGHDVDEALGRLRDRWSEQEGRAKEEGRRHWLLATKLAISQALQVQLLAQLPEHLLA